MAEEGGAAGAGASEGAPARSAPASGGPDAPAGQARPRRLPITGPGDVHRRAAACGASLDARFAELAAEGWGEWPLPARDTRRQWRAAQREASARGVSCALGADRLLFAGGTDRLRALGRSLGASGTPAVAEWGRWLCGDPCPEDDAPRGTAHPPALRWGPYRLAFGHKTYVMAVVNRTVTSFSEERRTLPSVEQTIAAAWAAWRAGADVVDLGAESSADRDMGGLDPSEEARRLLPVVEALSGFPALLSLDTRRPAVARRALRLGPAMLNDVDALADAGTAEVAAAHGVPVVLMHSGGGPDAPGVVDRIAAFLQGALGRAVQRGVAEEQVVLDAGFGFGKSVADDIESTRGLGALRRLGRPILHAPSRKRTIGRILCFPEAIAERLPGTAVAVSVGIAAGADFVRVHDLPAMARVARAADAFAGRSSWGLITAV